MMSFSAGCFYISYRHYHPAHNYCRGKFKYLAGCCFEQHSSTVCKLMCKLNAVKRSSTHGVYMGLHLSQAIQKTILLPNVLLQPFFNGFLEALLLALLENLRIQWITPAYELNAWCP